MKINNLLRRNKESKSKLITIRVTQTVFNTLRENNISQTKIFENAMMNLGIMKRRK